RLTIAGKLIHEAPTVRFGFREFAVRGSDFLLNGVPTHLRGHQIDLGWSNQIARLKELKAAGMNCFEFSGPKSHSWYGAHVYRLEQFEEALDYADENGLIAIPILPGAKQLKDRIFEPDVAKLYRQRLDKHIRRYGNHPSICLWYMHFNLAGYRWYLTPTKIDGSHKPDNQPFQTKERYSVEAQRLAMQADSRPLYHHACGNLGDIFSMNCYIGPTSPLQEREEWPAHWAGKRPFPLVACEHGLLLVPYWFRPRKFPLSEVYADEPIFDELTAKYLGRRAYDMLTPELFDLYDTGLKKPRGSRTRALVRQHPGYQKVKSLFAQHSLRSWRTYGVSGIIFNAINWDFKDSEDQPRPVMQALGRYFGDTDLFIAGPKGNWPSKDHAFVAGEAIRKQAVLLNDLTRDLPVVLDWRLLDSQGKPHASGMIQGVAGAGKATKLAFECDAPDVKTRTGFRLAVSAQEPQGTHFLTTTFALEVFPRAQPRVAAKGVLLFDPVGDTARILQEAGVTAQPLTKTSDLSAASLLIVGSQCYTDAFTTLSKQLNLDQAIQAGLSVLVFEQKMASPYGLELKEQSARRTFIAVPGHPFVDGLKAADLLNLRSESTLMEPYPEAAPETERKWPKRFFKMGNRGVVATYVYTKPHFAPFVPILECGFDLVDSPLLAAKIGAGQVVLCQVDITPRYGKDPVSTRLLHNLLAAMGGRRLSSPSSVAGTDPAARAFLQQFGIKVSATATGERQLIVVGKAPLSQEQIAAVNQGATALLLPGSSPASGLQSAEQRLFIGRPTQHPLLAGISAADLYLKQWHTMPVCLPENGWQLLIKPGILAIKPMGKGQLIACTLDPAKLAGTRGRPKALRFWNLLLANLQAPRPALRISTEATPYERNQWETIPGYINW
ncbi:MAG: hypothetical protein HN904_16040, partial [Victivallales bacterium]|nr:hypothetical protein [Victivallales bacterium]